MAKKSTKSPRVPKYRLHKPSGRAVVTLDGKDHYLGGHGTPESRAEYDRLIGEWLVNGRVLARAADEITVNEVILAYGRHAEAYYAKPDGTEGRESEIIKLAMRPVRRLTVKARADSGCSLHLESQDMRLGPATASSLARARQILEGVKTRVQMIEERRASATEAEMNWVLAAQDAIEWDLQLMAEEAAEEAGRFDALDDAIEKLDDATLIDEIVKDLGRLHYGFEVVAQEQSHPQGRDPQALRHKLREMYAELFRKVSHAKGRRMTADLRMRFHQEVVTRWEKTKIQMATLKD